MRKEDPERGTRIRNEERGSGTRNEDPEWGTKHPTRGNEDPPCVHMGGTSDPLSRCYSDKSKCIGNDAFGDRKSRDTIISQHWGPPIKGPYTGLQHGYHGTRVFSLLLPKSNWLLNIDQ